MLLAGFLIGLFFLVYLIPQFLSKAYVPKAIIGNTSKFEESRRNQIILSYSYVFPLAIQTLLFSVVIGTQITRNLSEHGHGRIVYFSLSFPVFGFLIGYLFFKRTVKDK